MTQRAWKPLTAGLAATALAATLAVAQIAAAPAGPAAEVQRSYNGLKTNILKAADAMPADAYNYRPTPDIRSYARVVEHIIEAQGHSCGAVNGTPMNALPKVPDEAAPKAAIVQSLQASFAACDQAMTSLTDSNATQMLTAGPGKRSRIGLRWGTVSHDNEQYATLALYMRLKGIAPPTMEH